jgi:hypothetical protein
MRRWVFLTAIYATCMTSADLCAEQGQPAAKTRVLHFPQGSTIGYVYIDSRPVPVRPDPVKLDLERLDTVTHGRAEGLQAMGEARGDVAVPAGSRIRLSGSGDLDWSCLSRLDSNDLYAVWIDSGPTRQARAEERLLAPLSHLTGLRVLSLCNTGITGSGMKHLSELRGLQALELANEPWIRGAALQALHGLPDLA